MAKNKPETNTTMQQSNATAAPKAEATVNTVDVSTPVAKAAEEAIIEERVISIDRVARTQAGGRRIRFRAVVVVGDKQGSVGIASAKSNEITSAVAKASYQAKKHMLTVPIIRDTIPHEIRAKFSRAQVLLKPAGAGTSVIAGGSVRPVLELAGITNVVGKALGRTTNKLNNAYATYNALSQLRSYDYIPVRPKVKARKKTAAPTAAPAAKQKTTKAAKTKTSSEK